MLEITKQELLNYVSEFDVLFDIINKSKYDTVDIVINDYSVDISEMHILANYNISLFGCGFQIHAEYEVHNDVISVYHDTLKTNVKCNLYQIFASKVDKNLKIYESHLNKIEVQPGLNIINKYIADTIKHIYNSVAPMMTEISCFNEEWVKQI